MSKLITLETICEILSGAISDATVRAELGYLWIETGKQTIRLSLDTVYSPSRENILRSWGGDFQ